MNTEKIILVDINDNEIGSDTKENVHKNGMLHRAFSVFIFNSKNEMLIQKRQINKYHSGGLWANACCSHPRKGEDLEYSTIRRMIEELGFSCPVEEAFHFIYRTDFNDDLAEYEYDHVFYGFYDGNIRLNEDEASEFRFISIEELEKELTYNSKAYSSWFIIAAPKMLEIIKSKIS